ncbi:Sensor protein ZraS [Pirellulimonas nuda]|uniref:histidine kinase n=1 Tax=Pirellulimonas nuda TaxID=2528009 RepID=A0A518DAG1_9BACT|nr:Sensor protein ZraS [Pirellulimonas nuda]
MASIPSRRPEIPGARRPVRRRCRLPSPADGSAERFREALERAKLDAMKELAYGAGHEINNPLANIAARAQSMLKRETDAEKRRWLEVIHRQAMRAHEMIADLMLFARPPAMERAPVDVWALVQQSADEHRAEAEKAGIVLRTSTSADEDPVWADATQLAVALGAVIRNAIEAIGENGAIEVCVRDAPGWRVIEVHDSGPGISEAVRPHLFDPFFSGREAGRGLGFGLSKCWRIVTDLGGRVEAASPPGGGAVLSLWLPIDR